MCIILILNPKLPALNPRLQHPKAYALSPKSDAGWARSRVRALVVAQGFCGGAGPRAQV